ncbi:MAG: hypothetical protein AAGA38_03995 [Pseudomonadota bacterium]
MTAEMLAVFLNLLNPSLVETAPGQIIVNASEGRAVWTVSADTLWCTDAPVQDMKTRFEKAG